MVVGVLAIFSEFPALEVSADSSVAVAMCLLLVFADKNVVVRPVKTNMMKTG